MTDHFDELAKTTDRMFIKSLQKQLIQVRKEKAGLLTANIKYREDNRLGRLELVKLNTVIEKLINSTKSWNLSDYQEQQRMIVLNYVKVMRNGTRY